MLRTIVCRELIWFNAFLAYSFVCVFVLGVIGIDPEFLVPFTGAEDDQKSFLFPNFVIEILFHSLGEGYRFESLFVVVFIFAINSIKKMEYRSI